ncbi:MAG: TolC family protein, partial [Pontibacter sp.]|nr:TolC family protein [Pontibacter sp.]
VEVGIGIPLFFGAQKSRISAARVQEQISNNSYRAGKKQLQAQLAQALQQYTLALESIQYFEESVLPNAESILETADLKFRNGEINYLEWVLLTNQALSLQSDYLDAVRTYNQNVIRINTLSGK